LKAGATDGKLTMLRVFRILVGAGLVSLILYAASRAVRDCPAGPYVYENCLWLWLRDALRLPESKLLRVAALEFVGLGLLAGLYLTARFVFPMRRTKHTSRSDSPRDVSTHSA
jgi:hypothetical protein